MAVTKFDLSPDFLNNQLLNMVLQLLGTEPTAVQGKLFLDTAEQAVKVSVNGTDWDTLATLSDLSSVGVDMEMVMDSLGATGLVGGSNVTISYDDAANSGAGAITISANRDGGNAATLGGQTLAQIRARSSHTGTQTSSTISDLTEAVQDIVGAYFGDSTTADVTYDDVANTLTVAVLDSPTVGGFTPANLRDRSTHTGTQAASTISGLDEAVSDQVGTMVTGNTETGITVTYDDVDNTLDFAVTDSPTVGGQTPAQLRARSSHTGTQASSTISDFVEAVQDVVGGFFADTATIDVTYNDTTNTLTAAVLDSPTVGGQTPAQLRARSSHTGTQTASTISDFTTAAQGAISVTDTPTLDLTKTGGAISGAVLNSPTVGGFTPAQLRDRSTHTGTQTSSSISDFATAVNALAQAQIDALVDSAPGTLDTLNELAAALGDDPNFATTITTALNARAQTYSQTYGNASASTFTITHNLNTTDVAVSVREVSSGDWVVVPWKTTGANTISVMHTTVPASGQYRVTVIGRPAS